MKTLPDLFRAGWAGRQALHAYGWLLRQLIMDQNHARIIEVCREIRPPALKAGADSLVVLTYVQEFHTLADLQEYDECWRLLRKKERSEHGHHLDLRTYRWRKCGDLLYWYAPVLYFRGECELGCDLLEKGLRLAARERAWAHDRMRHVYQSATEPENIHQVALAHFYRALGRDLTEWKLWSRFVDDFPSQFFGRSGVKRARLRVDPSQLEPLQSWIESEQAKWHFSFGQKDLIQPAAQVQHRQDQMKARRAKRSAVDPDPDRFRALFPEVAGPG